MEHDFFLTMITFLFKKITWFSLKRNKLMKKKFKLKNISFTRECKP
jgi:hypothetical protein